MIIRQHLGKWYEAHSEPYCGGYARKCTDDPHAHASSTRDLDAHHHVRTSKEIAQQLKISPQTVEVHRYSLM